MHTSTCAQFWVMGTYVYVCWGWEGGGGGLCKGDGEAGH